MKLKNFIIGFLLIGILANVGFVFGENMGPEWSRNIGDYVNCVAITPDGKYIVAGSKFEYNGSVYLFNTKGDLLWKYETGSTVESVSITPDGKYIVAGSINVYLLKNKIDL